MRAGRLQLWGLSWSMLALQVGQGSGWDTRLTAPPPRLHMVNGVPMREVKYLVLGRGRGLARGF